jgi:hypothetical protein
MKVVQPTKFDALATVIYTENEVIPSATQTLREDSFKEPASGYSPEDWAKLPYRKRRYIVLRDRARSVKPGAPDAAAPADDQEDPVDGVPADIVADPAVDTHELPDVPMSSAGDAEDDSLGYGDVVDTPVTARPARTNAYGEVITNFVSSNPGSTRDDISEYLSAQFGDRLNTTDEIQDAIAQAVGNGDISFDDGDVAHVGEVDAAQDAPSDDEIAAAPVKSDADKARERASLAKRFLAWRKAKNAGALDTSDSDEEEEDDGEDDEGEPTDDADSVVGSGRGLGKRLNRAGVEFDD